MRTGPWLPPLTSCAFRFGAFRFGAFLDPTKLSSPEALERAGPFVHGSYRPRVRAIQLLAAVPTDPYEIDFSQHPEMLRDRRLGQTERLYDLADRTLLRRQEFEDSPSVRLGDRVEDVGTAGGP